jgi:hypothetical protein
MVEYLILNQTLDHFACHPVCGCRCDRNNLTVKQLIENMEDMDINYIWMTSFGCLSYLTIWQKNELFWDSHSKQKGNATVLYLLLVLAGFLLDLSFNPKDGGSMFL